jgi:hypothetical protein
MDAKVLKEFINESKEAFLGQENKLPPWNLSASKSIPSFLRATKNANTKKNKIDCEYTL